MSAPGGNGVAKFDVLYPEAVLQALRRLLDSLNHTAEQRSCAAALRVIHKRLRNDPLVFGEHRFSQEGVANTVRVAGVAPLIVRFAVYEDLRTVWVLGLHLLTH